MMTEEIINQFLSMVREYWVILLLTVCSVEIVKMFLPDEIEKKWIPISGIILAVLFSFLRQWKLLNGPLGIGLFLGVISTGGYRFFFDFLEKMISYLKGIKKDEDK